MIKKEFEYIFENLKGSLDDLRNNFDEKTINDLIYIGFIKIKDNNWILTNDGLKFLKIIIPKKNFTKIEKIQNFINNLIINSK